MATRADLDEVGWFDPAFAGWGGEDVALGWALNTLTRQRRRLRGPLWHLWHPPSTERGPAGKATDSNRVLTSRYRAAKDDPAAMRDLIDGRQVPHGSPR